MMQWNGDNATTTQQISNTHEQTNTQNITETTAINILYWCSCLHYMNKQKNVSSALSMAYDTHASSESRALLLELLSLSSFTFHTLLSTTHRTHDKALRGIYIQHSMFFAVQLDEDWHSTYGCCTKKTVFFTGYLQIGYMIYFWKCCCFCLFSAKRLHKVGCHTRWVVLGKKKSWVDSVFASRYISAIWAATN